VGLGSLESSTAPGDSGGPVFFGNQIVAITTFGASIGMPDVDGKLNSSFGELNGFTYVGYNRDWLDDNYVPEPSLYPPAALALAAMLAAARKRRAGPRLPGGGAPKA
jgi:hypothetical protein